MEKIVKLSPAYIPDELSKPQNFSASKLLSFTVINTDCGAIETHWESSANTIQFSA